MMIASKHYQDVEAELRRLLDSGELLGDALRMMHHTRHVGLMFLWPAVMAIRQIDRQEAMRIVVHETANSQYEGGVSQ